MKEIKVFYSHNVGAPADKIPEWNEELYYKLREVGDNTENDRYAHYYQRQEDEYGHVTYVYMNTTNA